uniref:Sphingosine kinase 1 n=2 Tax=Schistocephalus solidus TaxID=70667 RepID=A0A0X3Q020_SCHSO
MSEEPAPPVFTCICTSPHSPLPLTVKVWGTTEGLLISQSTEMRQLLPWSTMIHWVSKAEADQSSIHVTKENCVRFFVVGLKPCGLSAAKNDEILVNERTHLSVNGMDFDRELHLCCFQLETRTYKELVNFCSKLNEYSWCSKARIASELPILLIVNPKSGQGKAKQIVSSCIGPLFQLANIQFHTWETQYAGHAVELVSQSPKEELLKYRALVAVSGDGLLQEIVNGLFARTDLPSLPNIGVLPAGSGNAVSASVCFNSGLQTTKSLLKNACLLMALPPQPPVALAPLSSIPRHIFRLKVTPYHPILLQTDSKASAQDLAMLSVTWGLISECDLRSEVIRCLGEVRFSLTYAYFILKKQNYRCSLSFLPVDEYGEDMRRFYKHFEQPVPRKRASLRCTSAPRVIEHTIYGGSSHVPDDQKKECRDNFSVPQADGASLLPPLEEPVPPNWVTISGDFWGIQIVNTSHLVSNCVFCAEKQFGSDFMLIQFMSSRLSSQDLLDMINMSSKGHGCYCHEICPTVAVKAFRITSETTSPYIWTKDGERLDAKTVQGEVWDRTLPFLSGGHVERQMYTHFPDFGC